MAIFEDGLEKYTVGLCADWKHILPMGFARLGKLGVPI
jgi:hypothetical protein